MREIKVEVHAGEPPRVTVDGTELPSVSAVRVLGAPGELPAAQVEFRGDINVSLVGGTVELMRTDDTAALIAAVQQIDPGGLERAILDKLGGLGDGEQTTGQAAKAALLDWAQGHGAA